jgi:hypothetical protein
VAVNEEGLPSINKTGVWLNGCLIAQFLELRPDPDLLLRGARPLDLF